MHRRTRRRRRARNSILEAPFLDSELGQGIDNGRTCKMQKPRYVAHNLSLYFNRSLRRDLQVLIASLISHTVYGGPETQSKHCDIAAK